MPEGSNENIKLNSKGVDEESIRESRPGVFPDESHEEPKSNEHHNIDVLIEGVISGCKSRVIVDLMPYEDTVHNEDDYFQEDESEGESFSISQVGKLHQ